MGLFLGGFGGSRVLWILGGRVEGLVKGFWVREVLGERG